MEIETYVILLLGFKRLRDSELFHALFSPQEFVLLGCCAQLQTFRPYPFKVACQIVCTRCTIAT